MNIKDNKYLKILRKYNGAMYQTALQLLNSDKTDNVLFRTNVLAVAPIIFTYIHWVIEEARKNQIKRLYFLARDGYIMKKIAMEICEKMGYDLECKYLYCSRIAWRIPQYYLEREKCLDKICINSIEVNIEKMFDRANLTEEEKDDIAHRLSLDKTERYRHLQWYEVLNYKEILAKCDTFLSYVYKHSVEAYDSAIGYLKQEGLFDEVRYALVDTGWTGSMQTSLSCLLDGKIVEGFYFGTYNIPKNVDQRNFHTFLFSKDSNMKYKVYFNNNLFECLCSSPDGMTIGYAETKNGFAPVYASERNMNIENWDLDLHISTIMQFTGLLLKEYKPEPFSYNKGIKLVHKLCKEFMIKPSIEEAMCYGDFRFSDDVKENNIKKLAEDMNLDEIKQNLFLWRFANFLKINRYNKPYKQTCWIEGSIVKCTGINVKKYIRHIVLFRWVQYFKMKIL